MAYKKFDDATKAVAQSPRKVYDAIPVESFRRAIQSISNRILGGTGGTGATSVVSACGTGATGGLKWGNTLLAVINGRFGTVLCADNLELPAGTQASATYVKYLISGGFGTGGTVTAGNEGTSSTKALLPDCPDGHVAVGYMEYAANSSYAFIRTNRTVTGGAAATAGTASFKDLIHMPYSEE